MANQWLRDLHAHQSWADAEHWRAVGAHPAAYEDLAIRGRLHHIHFVQHAFLWTIGDRTQLFTPTKVEDFSSFDALRSYARSYHEQALPLISALSDARLAESVSIVGQGSR